MEVDKKNKQIKLNKVHCAGIHRKLMDLCTKTLNLIEPIKKDKKYTLGYKLIDVLLDTTENFVITYMEQDLKTKYENAMKLNCCFHYVQSLWILLFVDRCINAKAYESTFELISEIDNDIKHWINSIKNEDEKINKLLN